MRRRRERPPGITGCRCERGFRQQLDGSRSFSLADGSAQVTYQWAQLSGPTTVRWSDTTSATPTIQGLIFGTYTFQLTVKDVAGNTASTTLQIGAVATDANGVVVQADPNADKLFGPMIAFGQNPWGYADERALRATTLRSAAYDAQGLTNPTWETPLAGTVTYKFWPPFTKIAADISSSAMSIQVNDVSQLDLTTFPTRILLGNAPFRGNQDLFRLGKQLAGLLRRQRIQEWQFVPRGTRVWGSGTRCIKTRLRYRDEVYERFLSRGRRLEWSDFLPGRDRHGYARVQLGDRERHVVGEYQRRWPRHPHRRNA